MGEGGSESTIPLQGSYLARRCPVAGQLDFDDSLEAAEELPTEAGQARADRGIEFEREIFATIVGLHGEAVAVVEGDNKAELQAGTASAMASDSSIVLGGWLPDDLTARRTGRPDVLLRVGDGWIPVDVKHHGAVRPSVKGCERRSEFADPWPSSASEVDGVEPSVNAFGDALQLAHYWCLLESAGLASATPIGGIIGRDAALWWFDLAEPRWKNGSLSALEAYEREFDLRLRVIGRQLERNADDRIPPLVIPLRKAECPSCRWRLVCGEQLEEDDSVSLLDRLPWPNALRLIRQGVATRTDLARLDWDTAWVMHGDSAKATTVDLVDVLSTTETLSPSTGLRTALGRRKKVRLARLEALGMTTVGDLGRLDHRTAQLSRLRIGYLPTLIDQARAAIAGQAFLLRGIDRLHVPRADVEVDVDMECNEAGVYLWGARTSRGGTGDLPSDYRAFVSWDPLVGDLESEVFSRFWGWLTGLRDSTISEGRTFVAYCYSGAENTMMRRIADRGGGGPNGAEVESFIAGPHWVDLHAAIKSQILTGGGLGLKQFAPLAGFDWRDQSPGGDQSTVWYDRAVNDPDPEVREVNRARLLAYNEDDVRATAAIRDWLSATSFAPIASYEPGSAS